MKREIPILYSTPMVRAKLDGRKSVTRRLSGLKMLNESPDEWDYFKTIDSDNWGTAFGFYNSVKNIEEWIHNPYGRLGDIHWVREMWNCISHLEPDSTRYEYYFKADSFHDFQRWKPSIHMPKAAARIWEEVVSVRPERLQDITEKDAILEGAEWFDGGRTPWTQAYSHGVSDNPFHCYETAIESFKVLWISINGQEIWDLNPWVWRIETKTLSTTGRPDNL